MMTEQQLREKLRKIQQLYEGSRTPGERDAAAAAMNRVKQALDALGPQPGSGQRPGWMPSGFGWAPRPEPPRQQQPPREPPQEPLTEIQYTFPDQWRRRLFAALCRRYGLNPFRYKGQRYTTVMLKVKRSFSERILWPEYLELEEALSEYLEEATERIIREEIFSDAAEPGETRR